MEYNLQVVYSPIIQVATLLSVAIIPMLFGIILKPKYCIFAYLIIHILIPKQFHIQIYGNFAPVYAVLELSFVAGIFISLIMRKYTIKKLDIPNYFKWFLILLFSMYIISTVIPILLPWIPFLKELSDIYIERGSDIPNQLYTSATFLGSLIFLLGVFAYVNAKEDIDVIFKIFVIIGVIAVIENVLFYHLNVLGLKNLFLSDYRSYNSLIIGPTDFLGRVILLSACVSLYFLFKTKKVRFFILHLFLLLILFDTRQRGILLGILCGYFIYFFLYGGNRKIPNAFFFLFGTLILFVFEIYSSGYISYYREGMFDPYTLLNRFSTWERGVDVYIHTFPFGTGAGYVPRAMSSQNIASHDPFFIVRDGNFVSRYHAIVAGKRYTSVHNLWLDFICEHGFLGLISLVFFVYIFIYINLQYRNKRLYKTAPSWLNDQFKCVSSMLVALSSSLFFASTYRPYSIIVMLLSFNVMLVRKAKAIKVKKWMDDNLNVKYANLKPIK